MTDQEFIGTVYDILAQNKVSEEDKRIVLEQIEYVDSDELEIVFKNAKGKRYALQLNRWDS